MTEESFQAARKVMQRGNYLRGIITKCKGDVAKWTRIEDFHRKELRHSQADGAKKILDKTIKHLNDIRLQFKELKFPDDNIQPLKSEKVQCENCGQPVNKGETYCKSCIN